MAVARHDSEVYAHILGNVKQGAQRIMKKWAEDAGVQLGEGTHTRKNSAASSLAGASAPALSTASTSRIPKLNAARPLSAARESDFADATEVATTSADLQREFSDAAAKPASEGDTRGFHDVREDSAAHSDEESAAQHAPKASIPQLRRVQADEKVAKLFVPSPNILDLEDEMQDEVVTPSKAAHKFSESEESADFATCYGPQSDIKAETAVREYAELEPSIGESTSMQHGSGSESMLATESVLTTNYAQEVEAEHVSLDANLSKLAAIDLQVKV